jgi:hypothetical protein
MQQVGRFHHLDLTANQLGPLELEVLLVNEFCKSLSGQWGR